MRTTSPQDAIRSIPETILGTDAADMLHDYAGQLRTTAKKAPNGIFQVTYGIDQALKAADDIDAAGSRFRLYGKIVRPSATYSELQTLVGRAVTEIAGINGQIEVFDAASAGFIPDIINNAKNALDVGTSLGKWIVVGAVAALVIVLLFRFGGSAGV